MDEFTKRLIRNMVLGGLIGGVFGAFILGVVAMALYVAHYT